MAKTPIISEGKTIEEAIEIGLSELGVKLTEVDVEIIAEPQKRFFGRKSGTAKVRLTLKDPPKSTSDLELVSVVDGQLHYVKASPTGIAPTISFGKELQVFYKGEQQKNQVVLSEGLEPLTIIMPEANEPELHYEIVVNETKTKAQLVWDRSPGEIYSLNDHPATNQLSLTLSKTLVEAPTLSIDKIREMVQVKGLSYGLHLDDLTVESFDAPKGLVDLATGVEPRETRHASIRYVFQEDSIDFDALRIDHYEAHGIVGVQEGTILAEKEPGELGAPGMDVYGDPIHPQPLRDIEIQAGEGVELSPDGLQAIAKVSGLPSMQGGVIRVTEVFELPGDADVSTGNITIDGDIMIRGNVMENVKIDSNSGMVIVHGLVSGATVRAGESITVLRNVVRSQLYAGGFPVAQIRVTNMLQQISNQLEALLVAYESIVSQAEDVRFESLIKHLIELKFAALPQMIRELSTYISEIDEPINEDLVTIRALLNAHALDSNSLSIVNINELFQFRSSIEEQIARLESMSTTEANVKVGYMQNSRVEASGFVEVTGQGCFYSTVLAGAGFSIKSGVFRGGEVTVNSGNIAVKELGGPTGVATTAQLIKNGRITANLVHPNVTVAIGTQSYKFYDTASQVKAYLHEDILTVYSGSMKIHG